MFSIQEAALSMASLSVYKGILQRTVPKAFYRLLCAAEEDAKSFAEAWGSFFSVLSERGFSKNVTGCLSETALFDDNAFSRACAAGKEKDVPDEVLAAVKRDLDVILQVSSIAPDELLRQSGLAQKFPVLAASLPRWQAGEAVLPLRGTPDENVRHMAAYCRKNGCGMFARYRAFIWRGGKIEPVAHPDPIRLKSLKGYEYPRTLVQDNTAAFLQGLPANNCLLYGDRGTGKSSTVKALLNELYPDGLRMIEMPKESLMDFPVLVDQIAAVPMRFIIFIDDLSFTKQNDTYAALKAVLEGGLASRPANALIYATSNRRHLVAENFSDRQGDDLHRNDTIQESLSLADRFGLSVNFSIPDKAQYLAIVHALAKERGLQIDTRVLELAAERFAMERGGRSPRCATQFITLAESRLKRGLDVL